MSTITIFEDQSSTYTGGDSTYRTGGDSTYQTNDNDMPVAIDSYRPDPHPVLSPASGFESFFISPELRTPNISANVVASRLHRTNSRGGSSVRSGTSTIATDDFASACEDAEHMPPEPDKSLFGKDILILSRNVIPEDDDDIDDDTDTEEEETTTEIMSTKTKTTPPTTPEGINATQVVYEKIKDVWTWGKTLPVVSTFEEVTEKVAIKLSGSTLADIDGGIKPHLKGFDTTYVNPAVKSLVDYLTPLAAKADSTLKPIIASISSKLPMIKSDKKETTPSPELTTAPVTAN